MRAFLLPRSDVSQHLPIAKFGVALGLACEDGGVYKWEICRFDLLLTADAKRSKVFRDLLLDTLRSSPQLDICLCTDEVSPGNTMALATYKKSWSFYVSFLQFGEEKHWFLQDEDHAVGRR